MHRFRPLRRVTYQLVALGHITALTIDRWGDPDSTGGEFSRFRVTSLDPVPTPG